jgi:hypothetical protein
VAVGWVAGFDLMRHGFCIPPLPCGISIHR